MKNPVKKEKKREEKKRDCRHNYATDFWVGIFVGIPRAIFTRERDNRKSYLVKRGMADLMDTQRWTGPNSFRAEKKCQRRVTAFDCVCGQSSAS